MTAEFFNGPMEVIGRMRTEDPFESFAFDDFLQHQISEDNVPKVRFWVHSPYIILGLQDARLPKLSYGLDYISDAGFDYIVRNSGGLGVVLDEGVLNLSLILPKADFQYIENGYDIMTELVTKMFPEGKIEAYEISASYCPGTYDLSIGGKKFAGISQRRIKDGVAVQIYLSVTGSGSERALMMQDFYRDAHAKDSVKFTYPVINPDHMASLNELLGADFSIEEVEERALQALRNLGAELTDYPVLNDEQQDQYEQFLGNIKERNRKYVTFD